MLQNSFIHIPGVGAQTEDSIWAQGIETWDQFLATPPKIGKKTQERAVNHINASKACLDRGELKFFECGLGSANTWRLFEQFRDDFLYFDIETTGLSPDFAKITTIATYNGNEVKYYVRGKNLNDFLDDLKQYKGVITFNGKRFDVPFIEKEMKTRIDMAHIDIMYVLKSLGLGGGQKRIEHELGLERGNLEGVDGFAAVLLWKDYARTGNEKALETLLAYNIEDTVNMERLMLHAWNGLVRRTPFPEKAMPMPKGPKLPFEADEACVKRIRSHQRPRFF